VHRLLREVFRKRDRHRTSTKLRLGVIKLVYELCKRPSYESDVKDALDRTDMDEDETR